MSKLYFINNLGEEKIICEEIFSKDDVWQGIQGFIDKCNENKPEDKKFKSYYSRIYKNHSNDRFRIDVGSHTEFFETDFSDLMQG